MRRISAVRDEGNGDSRRCSCDGFFEAGPLAREDADVGEFENHGRAVGAGSAQFMRASGSPPLRSYGHARPKGLPMTHRAEWLIVDARNDVCDPAEPLVLMTIAEKRYFAQLNKLFCERPSVCSKQRRMRCRIQRIDHPKPDLAMSSLA